ncbi:MAG: hypothetical protein D6753_00930 [Planctomycetota bacterium]|nr:MAG: hypothetical protein D6753_00930 [Planctomycetota bacterium]
MLQLWCIIALAATVSFARAQDGADKPESAKEKPAAAEAKQEQPAAEAKQEKPAEEKPAEKAEEKPAEKAQEGKKAEEKPQAEQPAKQEKEQAPAEEKAEERPPLGHDALPGTVATVVLEGLNNPCGIAIQPETGTIFISDSGNHQVVRVVDGKAEPVITDFPGDVYGKGPVVNIGPLGLLFLDQDTLVVGGGGLPDGEELLRVYNLPKDGKPIKADAMVASFSLAATDEIKGEGNFYALAATDDAIFVTCNGDDTKGWVSRATREGDKVTGFERWLATKEATEVDAPVGATISPQGYLVIGQMGEINVPGDSLITFYDAKDGKMLLNLQSGLHDICAVAYSKRGQMYVLDYAWADAKQGGLFQVLKDTESETGMRTKRILSLDKPTAMVFDADGALYVTIIGELAEDGNSKGQLIKIDRESGL